MWVIELVSFSKGYRSILHLIPGIFYFATLGKQVSVSPTDSHVAAAAVGAFSRISLANLRA